MPQLSDVLGAPELAPPAPQANPNAPQGDPAVWTLLGEAGTNPQGQLAVASTLYNRQKATNAPSFGAVASDPAQGYEAWQDANARTKTETQFPVGSPEYVAAAQRLADLQAGKVAALPYDSFYSPQGQAAKGRQPPAWADNTGVNIGGNLFYSGKYQPPVAPQLTGVLGLTPEENAALRSGNAQLIGTPAPAPTTPGGQKPDTSGLFMADGRPMTQAQAAKYKAILSDPSRANDPVPLAAYTGGAVPQTPGVHWIDQDGTEHIVAGGLAQQAVGTGVGAAQGTAFDTAASASRLTSGGIGVPSAEGGMGGMGPALAQTFGGQDIAAQMAATRQGVAQQQRDYQIRYGNNAFAQAGRFGGQLVPSTIAALAVPELEAPEVAGSAFANTALRGGAKVATNALRGTAAAAANVGANPNVPIGQQLATGGVAGAVAPFVPGAGAKVADALIGARVNPAAVAPEVLDLAQKMVSKYKIPLRALQIGGASDPTLASRDAAVVAGNPALAANNDTQRRAWNAAVMQEAGAPPGTTGATKTAMSAARDANGKMFQDVASRNNINDADATLTRLGEVVHDAQSVLPAGEDAPLLKHVEKIASTIQNGQISGPSYLALTRTGSTLDRLASGNSNAAFYAQKMRSVLDDGLAANASPEDIATLSQARAQWKAMKTIEPLAEKAGPTGQIDPEKLLERVRANPYNADLAYTGAGNLGELAEGASTFMRPTKAPNPVMDFAKKHAFSGIVGAGALGDVAANVGAKALTDPLLAAQIGGAALGGAAVGKGVSALRNAAVAGRFGAEAGAKLTGAPGSKNALTGLLKATQPVQIPLSALAGVRGLNPTPVGSNAQ